MNTLAFKLLESRILILTGEPETGKTSLALLIASGLWSGSPGEPPRDAALCRYLPGTLRVDLAELAGREKEFHQRILILKNAFASNNEDLLRFVTQLSDSELATHVGQLRESRSFLLLTADQSTLPGSLERLRSLGILADAPKPAPEDLSEGLRWLVQRLTSEQKLPAADPVTEKMDCLIAEEGKRLTQALGSMPRLARFVREYLVAVASGAISLEDALKHTTELGPWLLEELPSEPEVWCATVALALCAADRSSRDIPWFKFDVLQRALFRFLRRELQPDLRRREIRDLCRSELVLKRARAEIVTIPFPDPDVVRFLDDRYPDRLWQALLGPGKGVAAGLVPLLRKLAADEDAYLRQCAAQALGRIGQIDPFYITYPLIEEWSRETEESRRNALDQGTLLGNLFQGIWSAQEDIRYQQGCFQILRWSARNGRPRTIQNVLFSLHQIATLDRGCFALAMDILKEVAEKRLTVRWKALHGVTEKFRTREELARLVEYVFEARGGVEDVLKKAEQALQTIAITEPGILEALRFTLVRLLLWPRYQGETLRQILDWVHTKPEHFGPLVAFLFLGRDGIGYWLERTASLGRGLENGSEEEGSLLLEAMCSDKDFAQILGAVVEAIYIHHRSFPGLLREALERSFMSLLASWAREARSIERLHAAVTALVSRLYASHDEEAAVRGCSAWPRSLHPLRSSRTCASSPSKPSPAAAARAG